MYNKRVKELKRNGKIPFNTLQEIIKNHPLTEEEVVLIEEYNNIISEISKKDKVTKNYLYEEYNSSYKYGIFQIDDEINVPDVIGYDKKGKEIIGPKYGDLHNLLSSFKKKTQNYYNNNIVNDLIKYELLK